MSEPELDSLIGSHISLISQQDIRYEGVLFSINAAESSIILRDVKCFGTEDRVTDPSKKVAKTNDTLAFVSFPGQEIKDLFVQEENNASATPAAPAPQAANTLPPAPPAVSHNEERRQKPDSTAKSHERREPRAENKKVAAAGTGAHLLNLRVRRGETTSTSEIPKQEFDFQAALNNFQKVSLENADKSVDGAAANPVAEVASKVHYKKDDFFDSISCDMIDRSEGKATRLTAQQERSLNQDTFGAISLQSNYRRHNNQNRRNNNGYHTGNYGASSHHTPRGGGGRGGGRGRGRGGGRGRFSEHRAESA